jgi:hypothetical protein
MTVYEVLNSSFYSKTVQYFRTKYRKIHFGDDFLDEVYATYPPDFPSFSLAKRKENNKDNFIFDIS